MEPILLAKEGGNLWGWTQRSQISTCSFFFALARFWLFRFAMHFINSHITIQTVDGNIYAFLGGTWIYPIRTVWHKFSVNLARKFLLGWLFKVFLQILFCFNIRRPEKLLVLLNLFEIFFSLMAAAASELKQTVILVCCLHILWYLVAAKCLPWSRWVIALSLEQRNSRNTRSGD